MRSTTQSLRTVGAATIVTASLVTTCSAEQVDPVCDIFFQTYIVRGSKIATGDLMAASHLIASRGRTTGYWRMVLAELKRNEERTERNCVRILGNMLAGDASARTALAEAKDDLSHFAVIPRVCLGKEVIDELLMRAEATKPSRYDHYAIALARSRDSSCKVFFLKVLGNPGRGGEGYGSTALFFSAVGLAQLGDPAGFEWLIANSDNTASISNARAGGVLNWNLDSSCNAALRWLSGDASLKTRAQWEAWWKQVDRMTLPKSPVWTVDP